MLLQHGLPGPPVSTVQRHQLLPRLVLLALVLLALMLAPLMRLVQMPVLLVLLALALTQSRECKFHSISP